MRTGVHGISRQPLRSPRVCLLPATPAVSVCHAAWGVPAARLLHTEAEGLPMGTLRCLAAAGTCPSVGKQHPSPAVPRAECESFFKIGTERTSVSLSHVDRAEFSEAAWESHRCATPRRKAYTSSVPNSDSKAHDSQLSSRSSVERNTTTSGAPERKRGAARGSCLWSPRRHVLQQRLGI